MHDINLRDQITILRNVASRFLGHTHTHTHIYIYIRVCVRARERGVFEEHFASIIVANECFMYPDEHDTSVHIYQNRDVVTCSNTMTFIARHWNLRHHFTD